MKIERILTEWKKFLKEDDLGLSYRDRPPPGLKGLGDIDTTPSSSDKVRPASSKDKKKLDARKAADRLTANTPVEFYPNPADINQPNLMQALDVVKGPLTARYKKCPIEINYVERGCRGLGVLKLQSLLKTAQNLLKTEGQTITSPEMDGIFGPNTEKAYKEVMARFPTLNIKKSADPESQEIVQCSTSPKVGMCMTILLKRLETQMKKTGFNLEKYKFELDDSINEIIPRLKLIDKPGCTMYLDSQKVVRVKCSQGQEYINPYDPDSPDYVPPEPAGPPAPEQPVPKGAKNYKIDF